MHNNFKETPKNATQLSMNNITTKNELKIF